MNNTGANQSGLNHKTFTHVNGCFANNEDPDKMPHGAAFHRGLHYLLRQANPQRKKYIFMEIRTCDPSIYTMDHPDLTVSNFMEHTNGP